MRKRINFGKKWKLKSKNVLGELHDISAASPNVDLIEAGDFGSEVRAVLAFHTETLAQRPGGQVVRYTGAVVTGFRYHRDFMSIAPLPTEIVCVLKPRPFHPNIHAASGAICLGHPAPGITPREILFQVWSALTFQLRVARLEPWQALNQEAAEYCRRCAARFPLTARGLFEPADAEPEYALP